MPRAGSVAAPRWKSFLKWFGLTLFVLGSMGFGAAFYLVHKFSGERDFSPIRTVRNLIDYVDVAFNPEQSFPGQRQVNILCMGLDRNWTRQNMPFTKNSRSDTLMVASLNLEDKSVNVLSLPRDLRVKMPGKGGLAKINEAHSRGGVPYAIRTVEEFLGIKLDYYVVIKQEAIQGAIDRVGGLEVKVDKAMDYDDNWGHLHIHLKPGMQRLTGEQAVGYMRFRHDAEGDFGRIRRQQQIVQLLTQRMKDPGIILRLGELIDVLDQHVKTDLSRSQILALGKMFYHVEPGSMVTTSVTGRGAMIGGVSYVEPDRARTELLVDWLIRGNNEAANHLTSVRVVNESGSRGLGERVVASLREAGFRVFSSPAASRPKSGDPVETASEVLDYGSLPLAGRRVLEALGIDGKVTKATGRRSGTGDVTLIVRKDITSSPVVMRDENDVPDDSTLADRHGRGVTN